MKKNIAFLLLIAGILLSFMSSCNRFVNTAPIIEDQAFSINENSANETKIDTVHASDVDSDQKLSFSILSGNTNDAFAIDENTGIITVKNSNELNYEVTTSYVLSIKVSDNYKESLSDVANITININDVLEFKSEDGCVAYYSFSGDANDKTGNNHNGTVYGATLTTDRHGIANSAYLFDGINDYINTSSTFDYEHRTVSLWVNANEIHNAYPNNSSVIGQNSINLSYGAVVVQFDGGTLFNNAGGSSNANVYSTNTIAENTWYHMVLIRNGAETKYYINGALKLTSVAGTDGAISGANPLFIIGSGRSTTTQFFNGKVDDIAIFNRVLSESEISYLYGS